MIHTVFSVGQRLWMIAQHVVMSCECHDHTRIYRSSRDVRPLNVTYFCNGSATRRTTCGFMHYRICAGVIDMTPTGHQQ
jgi:hypothetical protein